MIISLNVKKWIGKNWNIFMQRKTLLYEIENVNVLYNKKPDVDLKKARIFL
jgi:hypothetical protein